VNKFVKQLTGQDNSFLEIDRTGLPQHLASVAIYNQATAPDGKVRFKQILELLESRLHLSPIFRSKLQEVPMGLDTPYLVDDQDFDLEYHVRHIALPAPGDWRQLCILLARINARPLDLSRPLWEMYVIEGLSNIEGVPPGSFALLIKIHHSVMDGTSAAEMMAAIHDFSPEPREIEPAEEQRELLPHSNTKMLGRAYLNALRRPGQFYDLSRRLLSTQRANRQRDETERTAAAKRLVSSRFNDNISPHRVLDAVTLDFAEIRAIKNTLPGATVNDVMLSIVSGALHKYLKAGGDLPEESLNCGCPVDVRDDSERGTGGNVIGLMGVNLCTEIADPLERFQAVHEAAVEAKAHAQASDVRINKDLLDAVPGGLMTLAMRASAAMGMNIAPYNTMLTNVPGPPNQLYFAGAQIVEGFGIGPMIPGSGLFHTACSTVMNKEGKITLSFWACRSMMPDPKFYRQCIEESHAELKMAALAKIKRRKRKSAK
jgi:diacylglycerol O-acyltransferase